MYLGDINILPCDTTDARVTTSNGKSGLVPASNRLDDNILAARCSSCVEYNRQQSARQTLSSLRAIFLNLAAKIARNRPIAHASAPSSNTALLTYTIFVCGRARALSYFPRAGCAVSRPASPQLSLYPGWPSTHRLPGCAAAAVPPWPQRPAPKMNTGPAC